MGTRVLLFLMFLILLSCRDIDCRYSVKNMSNEDMSFVFIQNFPNGIETDTTEISKNSEKVFLKLSGSFAGTLSDLRFDTVKVYIDGNLIVTWHEPFVNLVLEPRRYPYIDFFCVQDWDEFGIATNNIKWVFPITSNDLLEFPGYDN